MTATYWALSDSLTLIGRGVRHSARSIDAVMVAVILPVLILLMFVYVFGGALRSGGDYVDYVVPGMILLAAGFGAATTAVRVNEDMTSGVIDRFRSLPIVGTAVLTGQVVASVLRNLVATVAVLAVALIIGFRPHASALDWLAVIGILIAFMTAVSWLAAWFGLLAKSAETANAFSMIVMFLPYLSSAFVPTRTMPAGLRAVANAEPITPVVDTLRGLLSGSGGGDPALALAWCAGLMAIGVIGAALRFRRV
jgi:ABC-2 type transport system permease protein